VWNVSRLLLYIYIYIYIYIYQPHYSTNSCNNNSHNFSHSSIIIIFIKCQTLTQTRYHILDVRIQNLNPWIHGKLSVASTSQLGVNVCPHSADPIQVGPFVKFGSIPSTRSAHYPGNRAGHVPLEEAGSCKGEELLETPTLTHPKKILRQPFCATMAGPWVEGGGCG